MSTPEQELEALEAQIRRQTDDVAVHARNAIRAYGTYTDACAELYRLRQVRRALARAIDHAEEGQP